MSMQELEELRKKLGNVTASSNAPLVSFFSQFLHFGLILWSRLLQNLNEFSQNQNSLQKDTKNTSEYFV